MDAANENRARRLIALALGLISAAVYWQVIHHDFINFDDPQYVTENRQVSRGLSWSGVAWAFTRFHAGNWHPITWLSHMLDCQLFDLNPGAHHAISAIIHVLNVILLFWLLVEMTGATWRCAVVAGLFALHPLHVESVAWISERKDVLSAFFGLLALFAYARFARREALGSPSDSLRRAGLPAGPAYWLAFLFFTLGLMAKPMLVTLPFVLVLLDFWPLRRLCSDAAVTDASPPRRGSLRSLIAEKWPWFGLAAISCVVTVFAQRSDDAMISVEQFPLASRASNAALSYVRYVIKMFWPADLAVIYPRHSAWAFWPTAAAVLTLIAFSAGFALMFKRRPWLLIGWLWYMGMMAPVIGLVQVGGQSMADRYTYLPLIGLFISLAWGVNDLMTGGRFWKMAGRVLAIAALGLCAGGSAAQLRYWKNSVTLFERVVAVTAGNPIAQINLGAALAARGANEEARLHYAEAVRLAPADPMFQKSLGLALAKAGAADAAIPHLKLAMDYFLADVQRTTRHPSSFNSLGAIYAALGENQEALSFYAQAARLEPDNPTYQDNWGVALARQGDLTQAIEHYLAAMRADPTYPEAYNNLGAALVSMGRIDEAIRNFSRALTLNPRSAETRNNLAGALARQGNVNAAITYYHEALRLELDSVGIRLNLGIELVKSGQLDEAIAQFTEATRLNPGSVEARYQFGRSLVLAGKYKLAIAQLDQIPGDAPEQAAAQFYLGRAFLALRQPGEAIERLREALHLRPDWPEGLIALSWILATEADGKYRDGAEAVRLAEKAAGLTGSRQPVVLDVEAAAYAEAGRFDDAVATEQKAVQLAQSYNQTALAAQIQARLAILQSHRPIRSSSTPE